VAVTVDLTPIKDDLMNEGGPRFAEALAENLPQCAEGVDPVAEGGTVIQCLEEGVTVAQATTIIREQLPAWVNALPDSIQVHEPVELDEDLGPVNTFFSPSIREQLNGAITTLALVVAAFWLGLALLASASWRGRLFTLGLMLLIPAGLVLSFGQLLNDWVDDDWTTIDVEAHFGDVQYSDAFREAFEDTARDTIDTVDDGFLEAGGIAAGAAVLLIILSMFVSGEGRYADKSGYVTVPADEKPKRGEL
jgi:hypothetical protein